MFDRPLGDHFIGCNNYKIQHNDLLGTAIIIHTGGHGLNQGIDRHMSLDVLMWCIGGAATNGIVSHNMLWNANAAHWFDDIKQACLHTQDWQLSILPEGS